MSSPRRRVVLIALGTAVLAALTVLYADWRLRHRPAPAPADPAGALAANTRGVGLMEQFRYDDAAKEFEAAAALDRGWAPARINLAIALLNTQKSENIDRAAGLLRDVLAADPDNPHAHYCLGLIDEYQARLPEAGAHFAAVTRLDPNDAHAWYHRGFAHPDRYTSPESKAFFRKALDLDPYLNAARYALAQHQFERDEKQSEALLAEHQALAAANWETDAGIRYTEFGKYADAIGRRPDPDLRPPAGPVPMFQRDASFQVALAPGARWATAADLGTGPVGDLRRAVRQRFGATLVRLDYNRDGRPDLFLLGAVVEGGRVRDLLLRNDGGGRFTDVTAEAGLAGPRPSLGCAVGDFDNDGRPDLFVTGAGEQHLFRNKGDGSFEDVTAKAGLAKLTGVCLGASWVDLDQDGDLDLLVAGYADTAEHALARLRGEDVGAGGLAVFLNVGEAPPSPPGAQGPPPLTVRFRPAEGPEALLVKGPVVGVVTGDLDGDQDVDLLVLVDGAEPVAVLNDRLLRFHRAGRALATAGAWNGGLVLDVSHDERSDLFLIGSGQVPVLFLSRPAPPGSELTKSLVPGAVNSPPFRQAQAIDLDLDGWTDVLGLSADGKPVLLHNGGDGRLGVAAGALGDDWPIDLLAVAAADLDGDGNPDLLAWSESAGLQLRRNLGNGHHALKLEVSGRRDKGTNLRTNADGVGAWVSAQAGPVWTGAENTTLAAGLGQSSEPLTLGLGRSAQADFVRVRWPDEVPQGELSQPAGPVVRITEQNRKGTSCPVLLAWDGRRFAFVTDLLGAGSMGELGPDGSTRPPRPEESVTIEPHQLALRGGEYVIKIAEPMDEVLYLDQFRLEVIDHPAGVSVYPDERFATGDPQPSQQLLVFDRFLHPVKATDHRGRDVTETVRRRDKKMVDGFAPRSWLGFAEDHFIELDFGDQLASVGPHDRLFLVLAGWTDYPYPESIFAASQAGVTMRPPVLERLADGRWESLGEIGFPAGLPRVMTKEVTGLLTGRDRVFRIRTNLQIYWDEVALAVVPGQGASLTVTPLPVSRATLAHRGLLREVTADGRPPQEYDDAHTDSVALSHWTGRLTKLGDVTELLAAADDRFVICGPGDEVTVQFDARPLPPLPAGWVRSFVLRARGYSKDAAPFTLTGGRVEPLPFRAMANYPPGPDERPPAVHQDDRRRWQTRPAGR
jgi:hypothetical protein